MSSGVPAFEAKLCPPGELAARLADLGVSTHTFKVPYGWKPDAALIDALVKARLAEID